MAARAAPPQRAPYFLSRFSKSKVKSRRVAIWTTAPTANAITTDNRIPEMMASALLVLM